MESSPARRGAAVLTVAWPVVAAGGLWFEELHHGRGWNERVLLGSLVCAALVALLVGASEPSRAVGQLRALLTGAGLLVAGLVMVVVMLVSSGVCYDTRSSLVESALVVAGALAWPRVVLAASARARWFIAPAAGTYLLLATWCLTALIGWSEASCD